MKMATASALFVTGIVIALNTGFSLDNTSAQATAVVVVAGLVLAIANNLRRQAKATLTIAALLLVVGFTRGATASESSSLNWSNVPDDGEQVELTAWLDDDARRAGSGVRLSLQVTTVNDTPAEFPLTAFASGLTDTRSSSRTSNGFRYGDVYTFSGRFSAAAPEFAAHSAGTVFTGVVSLVAADQGNPARRGVAGMREWLSNNLDGTVREPASSIAAAMLVGNRAGISQELNRDFIDSGTAHILAISGLHIALISGLALVISASLFGKQGQYYLLAPMAVTWSYAAFAGFSPSVTRAAIMFSVILLARAAGRQNSSLPAIGFAAALMVAISPEIVRSLSFQLSFAAITGIAVLSPRLLDTVGKLVPQLRLNESDTNRAVTAVAGGLAVSAAATLATWPLIAFNFGGAPVWGGIATLLMLPAVPLLIIVSGIAAFATGISMQAGEVIGWAAWILGEFVTGVARLFRDIPPGVVNTEGWSTWTVTAAYGAIYVAFKWHTLRQLFSSTITRVHDIFDRPFSELRFVRSGMPTWSIIMVVIVAGVTWTGAITSAGTGDLTVTFFKTDRGDMILIRTPNGNSALIDGGRDPAGAVRNLDAALPFWDRSLDLLLVTHPDADHIGGLQAVVERYDVTTIAEAPTDHGSTVYAAWQRTVDEHGGSRTLTAGTVIALDDGIALEVLAAGRPFPDATINDASVVTTLRYGDVSMLLTGDITSVVERRLLQATYTPAATVLKVPHHGSDTSSTQMFLDAVNPTVAIVQVGSDNQFGHPTADVIERLQEVVTKENLFITSQDGDITVSTNGRRIRVTAEH